MTAIHETAYPRLKPTLTDRELEENFVPTTEELLLMQNNTKQSVGGATKLGFMLTLKCYQCLGRPTNLHKVSISIKVYIAGCMGVDSETVLNDYYQSKTHKRHIKVIRNYLHINDDRTDRRKCIKDIAIKAAVSKENLADIINDIIEELIKSYFELPGFHALQRVARAARRMVSNQYYNNVAESLSDTSKHFIDALLDTKNMSDIPIKWAALKQEPKSPTSRNVKIFIENLLELKKLREQVDIDISNIPTKRLEQFVNEAIALDAADMRKLRENRRYCLATILIHYKTASSIDDIATILIRWIRKLHTNGSQSLDDYTLEHAPETDSLIDLLHKMLLALKGDVNHSEKITAIENCITQGPDVAIVQCQKYLAYSGSNYYSFILRPYSNKRSLIFKLLDQLKIKSASNDTSIEEALDFIELHRNSHKEWLSVKYNNREGKAVTLDVSWLPDKWFKMVTGKTKKHALVSEIHRKYYELAVLTTLAEDLNSSDAYIEEAYIYNDPNKQFISWEQFYEELDDYCNLVKLPNNPKEFVSELHERLRKTACKID